MGSDNRYLFLNVFFVLGQTFSGAGIGHAYR